MNRPLTVLLVEDSPGMALALEGALRTTDNRLQVKAVHTLADARKQVIQGGVDVVLLDLKLPDAQGTEAIESIILTAPTLPLVVLTGQGPEFGEAALKAGAEDYFTKGNLTTVEAVAPLVRAIRYAIIRREARARFDEARRSLDSTGQVLKDLDRIEQERNKAEEK